MTRSMTTYLLAEVSMSTDQKTCFKCGVEQPLDEFYRHPEMADGHLNKCKACTKHDAHKHRRDPRFREKVLAYDRARGNRQTQAQSNAYRQQRPLVARAHDAVSRALRSGKLERPENCSHCSVKCKPHGHHEDYTKPLDVVWLCVECHRNLHAFYETVGHVIPGSEILDESAA